LIRDALAAALTDAPPRAAVNTAITVSIGCVVTPEETSSDAMSASITSASVCAGPCAVGVVRGSAAAAICTREFLPDDTFSCAFALRVDFISTLCTGWAAALADAETPRDRRAGLSPTATNIRVLTATVVSTITGKTHAVAGLYPMACIRSCSARKLSTKAPIPMAATGQEVLRLVFGDGLETILRNSQTLDHLVVHDIRDGSAVFRRLAFDEVDTCEWHDACPFFELGRNWTTTG
jgi:hypothetical protein